MSGGSYNYLAYAQDLEDVRSKQTELEWMAERLDGLSELEFPGCTAAARMTRDLILKLKVWETHAAASAALLSDVWKSIEWWDSNDWGPEQVRTELDKLVGGGKT